MKTFFARAFAGFIAYLKESRREMQKVNWPTRSDVGRMTLGVLVFSLAVALILGGFDFIFSRAFLRVLPHNATQAVPTSAPATNDSSDSIPIQVTPQQGNGSSPSASPTQ